MAGSFHPSMLIKTGPASGVIGAVEGPCSTLIPSRIPRVTAEIGCHAALSGGFPDLTAGKSTDVGGGVASQRWY